MSGVVDKNGVQWEHCCDCNKFVPMKKLSYLKPTYEHKYGLDLCIACADKGIRNGKYEFDNIRPGESWTVQEFSV